MTSYKQHFRHLAPWLLALLLLFFGLLIPPLTRADINQFDNHAGLVVQFGDGSVETFCVDLGEDGEMTGYELLEASEFDLAIEYYPGIGAAICKVEQDGCDYPAEACFCKCTLNPGEACYYWASHHLINEAWVYSSFGASSYTVKPGEVKGWAWGEGNTSGGSQPPLFLFDEICFLPSPTPTPTKKASPTPSATLTNTPTSTNTPMPTPSQTRTLTPLPTETAIPSQTPLPTETAIPSQTPLPTKTLSPSLTPLPTETLSPSLTPLPTKMLSPSLTPTLTPPPIATATAILSETEKPTATNSSLATKRTTATPRASPSSTLIAILSTKTPLPTATISPTALLPLEASSSPLPWGSQPAIIATESLIVPTEIPAAGGAEAPPTTDVVVSSSVVPPATATLEIPTAVPPSVIPTVVPTLVIPTAATGHDISTSVPPSALESTEIVAEKPERSPTYSSPSLNAPTPTTLAIVISEPNQSKSIFDIPAESEEAAEAEDPSAKVAETAGGQWFSYLIFGTIVTILGGLLFFLRTRQS